jgi:adenylate kinase
MAEVNIVVGLSGVGKGTVLEQAMSISDKKYEIINYGDKMVEIAKDEDLVESRDELKKLSSEENKRVQKLAGEAIVEEAQDQDVIVETHAAIQTPYGYIPGLPEWSVKALDPAKIIMIDADAEEIYERTMEDDSRDREHDEVEEIREYQEVAREMASVGAVLTGAYLTVIQNHDGEIHSTAEELIKVLRG